MEMFQEFLICSPESESLSDPEIIVMNDPIQNDQKIVIKDMKTKPQENTVPKKQKKKVIKPVKKNKKPKLDKILQKAAKKEKVSKKKKIKDSQIVLMDSNDSNNPTSSEEPSFPEPESPNDLFWNKSFSTGSPLNQYIPTTSSDDEKLSLNDELVGLSCMNKEELRESSSDLLQEVEYLVTAPSSEMNSDYVLEKSSQILQVSSAFLTEAAKPPMWLKIDRIESEVDLNLIEQRDIKIPDQVDENYGSCEPIDLTTLNYDEPAAMNMNDDEQTLMEIEYNTRMYQFFDDLEPATSKRSKQFKNRLSGCRKRRRESVESTVPENKPKKERKQRLRVFESEMEGPEPKRRRVGPLKIKCMNPKKLKQENLEKVMNQQKKASKLSKKMRKVRSKNNLKQKIASASSGSGNEDKSSNSESEKENKIESEAGSQSSDQSDHENQASKLQETSTDTNVYESQVSESQNSSSALETSTSENKSPKDQHFEESASNSSHSNEAQVLENCEGINNLKDDDSNNENQSDDFEVLIQASEIPRIETQKLETSTNEPNLVPIETPTSSEIPAKQKPLSRSYIKVNKIGRSRTPSNKPRSRRSKNIVTPFDVSMIHKKFTVHPENLELQSCQVKLENIMSRKLSKYENETINPPKAIKKQTKLFQRLAKRHSLNDLEKIRPNLQLENTNDSDMSTLNLSYADKCKYCKICDRMFALAAIYKLHMENLHSEDLDESVLIE